MEQPSHPDNKVDKNGREPKNAMQKQERAVVGQAQLQTKPLSFEKRNSSSSPLRELLKGATLSTKVKESREGSGEKNTPANVNLAYNQSKFPIQVLNLDLQ